MVQGFCSEGVWDSEVNRKGLLYLPCTVLPEGAKVFFGQLSLGYDVIPRGSGVPPASRSLRPLEMLSPSSCPSP